MSVPYGEAHSSLSTPQALSGCARSRESPIFPRGAAAWVVLANEERIRGDAGNRHRLDAGLDPFWGAFLHSSLSLCCLLACAATQIGQSRQSCYPPPRGVVGIHRLIITASCHSLQPRSDGHPCHSFQPRLNLILFAIGADPLTNRAASQAFL